MKKIIILSLFIVIVSSAFAQAPTAPQKEVEIPGRYYTHDVETDPVTGNIEVKIVCSVVYAEVCIKTKSPFDSPVNPQTQNGPLGPGDHYTSIEVQDGGSTTYTGDIFAHYQNPHDGNLNEREHRFYIAP